jgi:hypothetical protein
MGKSSVMIKPATEGTQLGFTEPRRIVVIFEDHPAREYALRSHNLPEPSAPSAGTPALWLSFDSLAQSAHADTGAKMAMDADLVVFAVSPAGDLPQLVKFWIEGWIGKRSTREGAIVGLVHRRDDPSDLACLKEIYLRHAAHRAGMDYLSHVPPGPPMALPESPDSYSERAGRTSSVLDDMLRSIQSPSSGRF